MIKINKIVKFVDGVVSNYLNKTVYVNYFNGIKNVGDILNIDIMEHYCGKQAINYPGLHYFKHYLAVGSVIHTMNENSVVMGSGLIHPTKLQDIKGLGKILALRGKETKKYLELTYNKTFDVPLGDPALLFPKIYNPKINKTNEFGLVLHYVDENHAVKNSVKAMGGKIISVRQDPEAFIDEIKSCDKIISSSMHGLILSDAYNIPNKRIVLSDNIFGGDFKFNDYYSTTEFPNEKGIYISEIANISEIKQVLSDCKIKPFTYDLDALELVFKNI